MRVKLTKSQDAFLGPLPKGKEIGWVIPKRFSHSHHDARAFAFRALKREHPRENATDWDAVVFDGMCEACGAGLTDGRCPECDAKIAGGL